MLAAYALGLRLPLLSFSLSVLHASGCKEVGSGMLATLFFSREGCCSRMNPFSQVENFIQQQH